MSCFVFVVNRSLFSQRFANWRSIHMWGSVLLICSYLYRCVWFKVVFLCVCVSLLCFIHVYFLLSGAAAVMELSRGEVPLYVSLTVQSSFPPPCFFLLFSVSLGLTYGILLFHYFFRICPFIISGFTCTCLCVREHYSRNCFGHPSFCILWTASLITAFTFSL